MDVYRPGAPSDKAVPAVILVHGDGPPEWLKDIKDWGQYVSWGELLAASGFVAITFNHRSTEGWTRIADSASDVEDLVALVALYRPGAMDQIPTYARGKRNPETINYIDERLIPITQATKGVILYQEQAMQIAKSLAGFSGPKADDLRKAIGKKNRVAMAALKPEFVEGCRAPGNKPDVIEWIRTTNERSAHYSFHRSHAPRSALIAYRPAWLQAN